MGTVVGEFWKLDKRTRSVRSCRSGFSRAAEAYRITYNVTSWCGRGHVGLHTGTLGHEDRLLNFARLHCSRLRIPSRTGYSLLLFRNFPESLSNTHRPNFWSKPCQNRTSISTILFAPQTTCTACVRLGTTAHVHTQICRVNGDSIVAEVEAMQGEFDHWCDEGHNSIHL